MVAERRLALLGYLPLYFGRGDDLRRLLDEARAEDVIWIQHGPMFGDGVVDEVVN